MGTLHTPKLSGGQKDLGYTLIPLLHPRNCWDPKVDSKHNLSPVSALNPGGCAWRERLSFVPGPPPTAAPINTMVDHGVPRPPGAVVSRKTTTFHSGER